MPIEEILAFIRDNPQATTIEIINHLQGKVIKSPQNTTLIDNDYKTELFNRVKKSDVYKNLKKEDKIAVLNYLEQLVQEDSNRFIRLIESGYFEMSTDIDDLLKLTTINGFFSKNYLSDLKKIYERGRISFRGPMNSLGFSLDFGEQYSYEPIIKTYAATSNLNEITNEVSIGDVAVVGEQLYVNDNGKMIKLKISKEKFTELFPLAIRYQTKQGHLGDCWLVSTFDNFIDMPHARAKLYQLFEQQGDDIIVSIPSYENIPTDDPDIQIHSNTQCRIKFKNGQLLEVKDKRKLTGCPGLELLEQAWAFRRGQEETHEFTLDAIENLVDIDEKMRVLHSGTHMEAFTTIFGYTEDSNNIYNGENIVGSVISVDTNPQAVITAITELSNDPNVLLQLGTLPTTNDSMSVEQTLNKQYFLYSKHAYTIKGYDENRGLVYFTNPWNSSFIVEMDVYQLLKYTDYITYVRID